MAIIHVTANHNDIVCWCEENISKVLWKKNGREWHGRGWCIEVGVVELDDDDDFYFTKNPYIVDITDEHKSTLFALLWC